MVFSHRKRARVVPTARSSERDDAVEGTGPCTSFQETVRSLFSLRGNGSLYNMQKKGEKERLVDDLWQGNYDSKLAPKK